MPTKSANVNGLNLVYEDDGAGPPIVFIHGFNGSAVQWEAVAPFLANDYRCIVVELRGHGRSARSAEGAYLTSDFVDEAIAFLDQVVSEPAVIVGNSLGGLLAFAAASRRPDLVRAIYSEDAVPVNGSDQGDEGVSAIIEVLTNVGRAVAEKNEGGLSHLQFIARLAAALPEWAGMDPAGLARFARLIAGSDPVMYSKLGDPDDPIPDATIREIERTVRCPVHVARADRALNGIVTEEHVAELERAGMDVTSTYFAGGGHIITSTKAKELLDDLRAFLARIGY